MGTTTTVSRRMIKMKKTNKPRVPLPRRRPAGGDDDDDQMVGEAAKPFVMHAPVRAPAPPRTWWQKALKPAALATGILVGCGFAYVVLTASDRPTYDRSAEIAAASAPRPAGANRARALASQAYPGSETPTGPIALSDRATASDESFRATAYVRKKVYLPNIDGDCVIKGGLDRVVGECLREQLGQ